MEEIADISGKVLEVHSVAPGQKAELKQKLDFIDTEKKDYMLSAMKKCRRICLSNKLAAQRSLIHQDLFRQIKPMIVYP